MPPLNIPNKEQRNAFPRRTPGYPTPRPPPPFFHRPLSSSSTHPPNDVPLAPGRSKICLLVNRGREEALGVLDVHRLHVAVQLLLGALLIVSLPGDPHAESVGNALNAAFPDLLVELGVETDVGGAL